MSAASLEQRVACVEQSLNDLRTAVLKLTPVKKDWRQAAGKLRDSSFAHEVDRRGQEYRTQQNQSDL